MKTRIGLLAAALLSISAWGESVFDQAAAEKVREKVAPIVFEISGVNGVGVSGCDPNLGTPTDFQNEWEFCVLVTTETEEAQAEVQKLYPQGGKVDDVYIATMVVGPIGPYPRLSGGN